MKIPLLLATLIIGIIFVSQAGASLSISPNPINVITRVGEENSFSAVFTNNHNFTIRDFSFSNFSGITFQQFELQPNQSRETEFTINMNEPKEVAILSDVKFNYLVDIPSTPQTHHINITQTKFDPSFLVIHEQDTVIWKNIDDITHTVTSSFFDYNVLPNQTVERIFTEQGTINYQDLVLYFGGTIEVLNRSSSQAVHNPEYDIIWRIDLSVVANPTTLEIENMADSNFTVSAIGSTEGLFKIKNIGNETAQSVKLSAGLDWIIFDENNFNLGAQEQKFVDYTIVPMILENNETNRTYEIGIKAKALNSEEVSFTIQVFIPFLDMGTELTEEERVLILWERICKNYPDAPLCTGKLEAVGNRSSITIRDPEVQFNFTQSTILDLLRRQRKSEDAEERTDNRITAIEQLLAKKFPELFTLANQSYARQMENERKANNASNIRWILTFFVGLIVLVGIVGYKWRRFARKREIAEGVT